VYDCILTFRDLSGQQETFSRRARSPVTRFCNNDDLVASCNCNRKISQGTSLLQVYQTAGKGFFRSRASLSIPTRPDRETAIVTVDDSNDLQISRFACFNARNRASGIPTNERSRTRSFHQLFHLQQADFRRELTSDGYAEQVSTTRSVIAT